MSERHIMRVRDVMNTRFETIDGMTTVSEALALMCKNGAECLIVGKRHADDEYGLLLVSDIARHVLGKDRAPERVNVYEISAKPVIAVDPQMDIRYCALHSEAQPGRLRAAIDAALARPAEEAP